LIDIEMYSYNGADLYGVGSKDHNQTT